MEDGGKNPVPGMDGGPNVNPSPAVTYCCCIADGITVEIVDVTNSQPKTKKGGFRRVKEGETAKGAPGQPAPTNGWTYDAELEEDLPVFDFAFDIKVTFKWIVRDNQPALGPCSISSDEWSPEKSPDSDHKVTPTNKLSQTIPRTSDEAQYATAHGSDGCTAGSYTAIDRVRQDLPGFTLKQVYKQSSGCPGGPSDEAIVEIDATKGGGTGKGGGFPGKPVKFSPPSAKVFKGPLPK